MGLGPWTGGRERVAPEPGECGVVVAAFYGVIVAMLAAFILLAGNARFLGPRGQRALALISAVVLAALGAYQLIVSLSRNTAA